MKPSPPLRVVIVDDEELARRVLREMLSAMPGIEIVAECGNGFEAVKAAHETRPDLMFLDIQMPKLDGFEVLELLGAEAPAVVFVTAHDAHALRAFEVHALDYLLKPFSAPRLAAALQRALARGPGREAGASRSSIQRLDAGPLAATARAGYLQRVAIRDGARITLIPVAKLDYAEAQDDYVALASGGKLHLKQQTIASLEAALDPAEFVRIHRSYLVRLERVARLEPEGRDLHIAVLDTGARLPVSRAGYSRLRALLESR